MKHILRFMILIAAAPVLACTLASPAAVQFAPIPTRVSLSQAQPATPAPTAVSVTTSAQPALAMSASSAIDGAGDGSPDQAALQRCLNNLRFVADLTIPDGTLVWPGQVFIKTWRVRNAGTCTWTDSYQWLRVRGSGIDLYSRYERVFVPYTPPGHMADISVRLVVPLNSALRSEATVWFQMADPGGRRFGQTPYVRIRIGAGITPPPPPQCINHLTFIGDMTLPDGTSAVPGQPMQKIWRVRNTGTCTWNHTYSFRYVGGQVWPASEYSMPMIVITPPGTEIDLVVWVVVPPDAYYPYGQTVRGMFQMADPVGQPFGPRLFVELLPLTWW